ncbi:MAG: hypothetical protein HY222_04365 [Thaumarchaeota archaeon]|nr:hypothetical protein [Nitrososphaerota archaeon]MBI3641609.1 hypothetical protein [Nitrososphaerota archaeon]
MNKKLRYLGLLLILPVFTVALTSTWETLPVASALTSRNSFNDNHYTSLYPGGSRICGDHLCGPGEYSKYIETQNNAQLKKGPVTTPQQGQTTPQAPTQGQNMHQAMTESKDLGSVLKLSNANLPLVIPLVRGLYDGKDVFYISTEASDSDVAAALTKFTNFPVTFAPALAKTPPAASANIYLFKNGVKGPGIMGFQPQVVDSIPGDAKYSPLWRVNVVEWKDPTSATMLGSEDEVLAAESNGKVTVTPTPIVVNCPIVQWGGDKEGTIPAGHMQVRTDTTLTDTTPYGGGQVLKIDTQKMQVTFVAHRGFGPDGSTIYYIVTDTVMADPAKMMGVILANKTQAALASSASSDLFQFGNGIKGTGPMGFQAGIGSTKPGDQFYSPLWRISMISWNDPSSATVLQTSQDITSHSDQTKVKAMGMIVNCPFISADTVFAHMK